MSTITLYFLGPCGTGVKLEAQAERPHPPAQLFDLRITARAPQLEWDRFVRTTQEAYEQATLTYRYEDGAWQR